MTVQQELGHRPSGNETQVSGKAAAVALVEQVSERWKQGEYPDAASLLNEHPELDEHRSVVLGLLYDEYATRLEKGESLDPEKFCRRFPGYEWELYRVVMALSWACESSPPTRTGKAPEPLPEAIKTFQHFDLLHKLGGGPFSQVFLAVDPELGERPVALKLSRWGAREAYMLGRLEHPNIVPVHSIHEDEASGLTAVCMPYLGNATLSNLISRVHRKGSKPKRAKQILQAIRGKDHCPEPGGAHLSPDPILRRGSYIDGVLHIAAQLADAVAFIHAKRIYHFDLKPANILLTPAGKPMLLDFHLAFDAQSDANQQGGTLPYMAPEQVRLVAGVEGAEPSQLGGHSDLFSLGVILYELLTGQHPFDDVPLRSTFKERCAEMLQRQCQGFRPVRQANPAIDGGLARLIESCLADDVSRRPASAVQLAAALRKCLSRPRRVRRWIASHARLVGSTAVLMLVAVLTGGHYLSVHESYARQQRNQGREAYRQGQYAQALGCFNRLLAEDPQNFGGLFARGRTHLRCEDYASAIADFGKADKLRTDGRCEACIGYCYTLLFNYREAVWHYKKAVADGFDTAEVFNDMGFSYLRLADATEALANLDQAIQRSSRLQAAFHNRALADLMLAQVSPDHIPEAGIEDVRRAIELGPASSELYRDAAWLCGLAATKQPMWLEPTLEYLANAIQHGHDPAKIQRDPLFMTLHDNPRFKHLLDQPKGPTAHASAVRLLDPISGPGE